MAIVYNEYNVDPILYILINATLTDTAIEEIKKRHPAIQWSGYKAVVSLQSLIVWKQVKYGRLT
eukprot:4476595-Ditylum_brightwellii.AAC.1